MSKRYLTNAEADAKAFDILQNMEPRIAQSFFWNFKSREERRMAILNWKFYKEINESSPAPNPAS